MQIRDLLIRFNWDKSFNNKKEYIWITYIDRGAPNDKTTIVFSEITHIGKKFFEIQNGMEISSIPFHRILKILDSSNNRILFPFNKIIL